MARKRAPGGGRKPKGAAPMRSQLTIRMPDDLRAELEAAARKRGHNLTDELLWRLRLSFAKEREQRRDPAMRALTFLIGELAENIHLGLRIFRMKWHKNPFMFQALKLGTTKMLDAIAPPGEIESPYKDMPKASGKSADSINRSLQNIANRLRTPEDAAQEAADTVLRQLFDTRLRAENVSTIRAVVDRFPDEPFYRMIADEIERGHYGMSAVLRDLEIEEAKEPKL
jgi:hypothetical protein